MADDTPQLPQHSGRVLCEFWCHCIDKPGDGGGYIYVKLNTALSGNHHIVCPNCGHVHHRFVKDGQITGDRFYTGYDIADEIIPMKSAFQREKRQLGKIALLRQREAIGQHT